MADDMAAPPLVHGECSHQDCDAPGSGCVDGSTHYDDCVHWTGQKGTHAPGNSGRRLAWTGSSFGTTDLEVVTAHRRVRLVAVVGAFAVGKTTALATYFLAIRKGFKPAGMRFAGSFTFLGWHAVTRHLAFPPSGSRKFPAHTTSAAGLSAAFLHLRLATQSGQHKDILFTDVPGEWFEAWAVEASAGEGAQWIAKHADLFVVMSDSAALAGPERGKTCNDYKMLANRVKSAAGDRLVIPVRAKSDINVRPDILNRLQDTNRYLFGREAQSLSALAQRGSMPQIEAFNEITESAVVPRSLSLQERQLYQDPFLDFTSPQYDLTSPRMVTA